MLLRESVRREPEAEVELEVLGEAEVVGSQTFLVAFLKVHGDI